MDRLRPSARWKGIEKEKTPVACRACRGRSRGARSCFKRSSGFARHAAKKNVPRFLLEKIPKETGERSFLGGMVSEPEFRRRRTMRVAWLIQRVHENHAARAMGNSDGGIISIEAIMDNPTGTEGHLPLHRGGKAVGVAPPERWGTGKDETLLTEYSYFERFLNR